MVVNRAVVVDEGFRRFCGRKGGEDFLERAREEPVGEGGGLDGWTALELFESQMKSRILDLVARELKARDEGYYTIGSAGHEGNVVLGRLLRVDDPCFLHYRSGALMVERSRKLDGTTPLFDACLSLAASREDPASGGRHKVFGSAPLWVPPQTSTIASHLPKAVGTAFMIGRGRHLGLEMPVGGEALVMCSFGDASVNHAAAQAAFNAAAWAAQQRLPVPLLLVCEDNGIGISVETPGGWIEDAFSGRPGLDYFRGSGLELPEAWEVAAAAVTHCRRTRRPTFLHLEVVRLLGHAGSDVETGYHTREQIEAAEACDPLLAGAGLLHDAGLLPASRTLAWYEEIRERVRGAAAEAGRRPKLSSAAEVMAPLAPAPPDAVLAEARTPPDHEARVRLFGSEEALPERSGRPRHLAVQINRALLDGLARYPEMLVFGEDVARKGGVYHVTDGLSRRAGSGRVFNTLLDETSILGLAIGAGHLGLLPVPEIQYLAYLHNAEDQLRGEACSLRFFSRGLFRNPMVLRIASFAYQKGFGGHFHNDSSIAVLRDIPGLVIAAPCRGEDAVLMLRSALAAAKVEGAVVAFLEPIALYMAKDLIEAGDGGWLDLYPAPGEAAPLGRGRLYRREERDLAIVTYANGVHLALRAAHRIEREHGLGARVVDLRWLAPLDEDLVLQQARETGRVLLVDEGRRTGGVAEALITLLVERAGAAMPQVARVTGEDTYVPLGPAADTVLPQVETIVEAARELCGAAEHSPEGRT